jgi:DNA modification methylase
MKFLHSEIGSAKDNFKSPVHNWYKFTAGFSHKFVDEIIALEKLSNNPTIKIFDAFAGCGTTLVSAQKAGVPALGNESQEFMRDIIQAKLNWKIDGNIIKQYLKDLRKTITTKRATYNIKKVAHPLLLTLYNTYSLKTLYITKDFISNIKSSKYRLFLKLALSQTLHKVSLHPIAIPYIVRSKNLVSKHSAWKVFVSTANKMLNDCIELKGSKLTSKIFLQDSRVKNTRIQANSCTVCVTSPPYLNNLDYGEVSKVHTHFFGATQSWNDITENVRKKLVTGATTHYADSEFNLAKFKRSAFFKNNEKVGKSLIKRYLKLKKVSNIRAGKKSFHILLMLYFKDMYEVLKEIRRVLKPGAKAYLILGDSAPYGVFIQTTKLLAKIALNVGFKNYKIIKIRSRGSKWKDLRFRHNIELTENVLVIK